jgi:hypothetical protein
MPCALDDWGSTDDLVLTYRYAFLPKGLINRLMVRMHRFVQRPDHAWTSGALFEKGETQLLAKTLLDKQEIELRARGPEKKSLLSVIASDLDALNARIEGLKDKVEKLIPCCCEKCLTSTTPASYKERDLLRRRKDGKPTIECPDSYQNVTVLQLLDGLKLETIPLWAKAEEQQTNDHETDHDEDTKRPTAAPAVRTLRIFLASSSELKEDRDAFDLHFRQENDRLRKQGIYLEIVRWENFLDAMSETGLQNEYNEEVRNCDIFVSLFKTKTGKYTEAEFNAAHEAFKANKKPQIYTYFKDEKISTASITEEIVTLLNFKKKLSSLGHYHTPYTSIDNLRLHFGQQLIKLIEGGTV